MKRSEISLAVLPLTQLFSASALLHGLPVGMLSRSAVSSLCKVGRHFGAEARMQICRKNQYRLSTYINHPSTIVDNIDQGVIYPDESVTEIMLPHMGHDSNFLRLCTSSLEQEEESSDSMHAVIVLNYQIPVFTPFLWSKARHRLCADGGANRIYDYLPTLHPHEDPTKVREKYKPDVIRGDMDSIRPEVKEFYTGLGTTILDESHDQDTTDLHKCVSYIKDSTPNIENRNMKILVLGALGGRLDHQLANINILYSFSRIQIILLSDESMAFLLPKNFHHEILIDPSIEGPHCGLIPLGGPSASTTTTGLKWNLENTAMQFGGLISTSNMYKHERVTVNSDADLVWTISIQKLKESFSNR